MKLYSKLVGKFVFWLLYGYSKGIVSVKRLVSKDLIWLVFWIICYKEILFFDFVILKVMGKWLESL